MPKPKPTYEWDEEKIDEAVLALLWMGLHDHHRAWKGFDWDAMNRLFEKEFIYDPRGKAKSVVFTEEGLAESKRLFEKHFTKPIAQLPAEPAPAPKKRKPPAENA